MQQHPAEVYRRKKAKVGSRIFQLFVDIGYSKSNNYLNIERYNKEKTYVAAHHTKAII